MLPVSWMCEYSHLSSVGTHIPLIFERLLLRALVRVRGVEKGKKLRELGARWAAA